MAKKTSEETQLAVIAEKIINIEADVSEIKKKLESEFVTRAEFNPIRSFVYGLIALVLTSVGGVILTLAFRK